MRLRASLALVALLAAACDDGPTSPSSSLALTCPAAVRVETTTSMTTVSYGAPAVMGGQPPVDTRCSPPSGSAFPAGITRISCQATDASSRTASCQTTVTVTRLPALAHTRFLAFGDSITSGEVTVPIGAAREPRLFTQVVVPAASYPSQLMTMLQGRYATQAGELVMVNAGRSGESVVQGVPRLAQLLANGDHEVLLLLDGYNDLLGSGSAAIPRVARALDDMAREARARGIDVYLAQLTPPIAGRSRSIPDSVIRDMNEEIQAVAAGEGAVLVDLYTALAPDTLRYIGVDGLHPTEAGYQRMAAEFFARIRETLEAR